MNCKRFHEILMWPLEIVTDSKDDPVRLEDWAEKVKAGSPWQPLNPYPRDPNDSEEVRHAESVYFHPFVQRFLYPQSSRDALLPGPTATIPI